MNNLQKKIEAIRSKTESLAKEGGLFSLSWVVNAPFEEMVDLKLNSEYVSNGHMGASIREKIGEYQLTIHIYSNEEFSQEITPLKK